MSLIHQELVLKITRFVITLTFQSVGKIYSTKTSFIEHFQSTIILQKRNLNSFVKNYTYQLLLKIAMFIAFIE